MNISFSATIPQFRARQKHVTRRGNANDPTWKRLKAGDVLVGCEKCQGLGKGGKIVKMGLINVLEVTREPLDEILNNDIRCTPEYIRISYKNHNGRRPNEPTLEGFPELSPRAFIKMFCEMNDCEPETEITRILFDYL